MYRKDKSIMCKNSVSALSNNLTCCLEAGKVSLAFVSRSHVNTLMKSPDGSVNHSQVTCKDVGGSPCTQLIQVKWVRMGNSKTFLVIASQRSFQIFEWDGSVFLHCHPFSQDLDASQATYGRGIGTCGSSLLCVGCHNGTILVHLISRDNTVTFCQRAKQHDYPITDIHSYDDVMASADDGGAICLWKGKTAIALFHKLPTAGAPCVSVRVWHDLVVAGYATGHVRVFSTESCQLVAEASAHARWISAIDVAPDTGLMLSVSEDSFVRVWQLDRDGESTIMLKYSATVSNSQLVGGAFMAEDGSSFAVVSYDSEEVFIFKK
ncbi:unnamed protein product [Ixodes pacificus]